MNSVKTLRSSLTIFLLSVVAMAVGFMVQLVLAAKLGTGWEMDVYLVGIVLPSFFTGITINAMTSALVPFFREELASSEPSGFVETFRNFFSLAAVAASILILVCVVASPLLIRLVAPGFPPSSAEPAAGILRIMFLGTFFDILRGALSAYYYTEERFFLPYFVPVLNHGLMLVGGLWLIGIWGVNGMAVAWTAGSLTMFAVLFFPLRRMRLFSRPRPMDPTLSRVVAVLIPVFLATILAQSTPILDRFAGSLLPVGSISYLGYGSKLLDLLIAAIPMAVTLALFPPMSFQAARNEVRALEELVSTGVRTVMLTVAPLGVFLILLREPLIMILFQRGSFTVEDTQRVSAALAWYMVALFPLSLVTFFTYVFFSIRRPWTLVKTGILRFLLTLGANLLLSIAFGYQGIAVTSILVAAVLAVVLVALFLRSEGRPKISLSPAWLVKILVATSVMGAALAYMPQIIIPAVSPAIHNLLLVIAGIVTGGFIYLAALHVLRVPEARQCERWITSVPGRLSRKTKVPAGDGPAAG